MKQCFDTRQVQNNFSVLNIVRSFLGSHPAFCSMGNRGPFGRAEGRNAKVTVHPNLVQRPRMRETLSSTYALTTYPWRDLH
jgi:hypothetical protein